VIQISVIFQHEEHTPHETLMEERLHSYELRYSGHSPTTRSFDKQQSGSRDQPQTAAHDVLGGVANKRLKLWRQA
jgi:hypothetical protein